jgi:two-component system NtrC family response regulator
VFSIVVTPLRERPDDIPLLAYHFLRQMNQSLDKRIRGFSTEAMQALIAYQWPGNIRELKNTVERLVIMEDKELLGTETLSEIIDREKGGPQHSVPVTNEELKQARRDAREQAVEEIERIFIIEALSRNDWNVTRAAESAGMQRTNFQALLKKYNITPKEYKSE